MIVELAYGKTGYPLALPDSWDVTVIRKKPMPVLPDARAALLQGMDAPIAAPGLAEAARRAASACILICDQTRPVPNGLILPPLIALLQQAGIPSERIVVMIATGLHAAVSGATLEAVLGDPWVQRNAVVINHDAADEQAHVRLGVTPRGLPVLLDRRFVEAGLRIVVGLVEPHFMAGYSGGRKLIAPGVAATQTIARLHCAGLLSDPGVALGAIRGNPLHAEQIAIAHMVGPVYGVNVVLDERRRVCLLNVGDLEQSHLQAVAFFREHGEVALPERFATVVSSAAGHPLDSTYYQTVKGLVCGQGALAPGGRLFAVSRCADGFGSDAYRAAQQRLVALGPAGFLAEIAAKPAADVDEWQTQMQAQAMLRGSMRLYTEGLSAAERALTGVPIVDSLEEALRQWVQQAGSSRVALIPEGPYVIPVRVSGEEVRR